MISCLLLVLLLVRDVAGDAQTIERVKILREFLWTSIFVLGVWVRIQFFVYYYLNFQHVVFDGIFERVSYVASALTDI